MVNAISPKMVANLENVLPRESVMELLRLLPDETITAIASAIPVSHVAKILKDATGSLNVNLTDIILDIPPSLLVKMLKKVVHAISPSVLKYLAITLPPEAIVRIVRTIPEQVVSDVLNVLPPKTLTRFIQAVPIETIISYVNVALNTEETRDPHNTLVTFTEHISNILKTLPATLLTKFVKAIPTAAIVEIVDILPKETIAEGASLLSGEEGFPLLSVLPAEAVAHAVTAIPPDCIVKVLDAIPQRTIGSFANMIVGIPTEQVKKFFTLVPVGALKHILTRLPPRTIEKLASSLPPETVEKMAHSVSSTTIEPIMQSFRPGELRRLIRSVSTFTLSKLLSAVPQDLMVNLTQSLPPEQIGKLFSAIPPEIISAVVTHLNPADMVALMKTMPPSIIENMLTTLPTEMMVNMTKILPPDQLQSLMDLLPKSMIGKMIAVLPQDVLVNLVTAFDTDAMLDMMQKLDSTQLIGILSTLPVETVVNLTKSQTPEQTMALLGSLPPDGIMNLTKVFPTDTFLDMLQSLPLEGVMQLMASMPLKDLFTLAGQLTPEQMTRVMETFANDPDFLPSMMAKVDFDRIASMVESVPSDLIMQLVSSVDMSKIMGVVKRMMPKVQGLVLKKIEGALDTLARNSTQTFAACLEDVEFVARNLLNFSEWAFKMVDASGKPGRGLLEGNIHMIGNFDQCKGIRHVITQGPRQGDVISGSYCHVQFHIPLEALPPVPGDGILPMPEIAMDVCLPHTCKAVDIHRFLKTFHLPMNVTIPRVACQQDMELAKMVEQLQQCLSLPVLSSSPSLGQLLMSSSCASVILLLSTTMKRLHKLQKNRTSVSKSIQRGAGVDEDGKAREKLLSRTDPESALVHDPAVTGLLMKKSAMETNVDNISINSQKFDSCSHRDKEIVVAQPDDRLWLRVATAFSLPSNLRLLLSTHSFNGSITCLHGIRVLSMLWVSFANSVIFSALNFENLMHAAQDLISLPAQMILNSSLAQDTFFTISGVVTAVTFFTAISSNGGLKITHIIYYYLHRFVRISPAYMLTLLVCTCLLGYTANGPHWPPPLQQQCQEQWWFNMLFINNYFTSIEHMCMSWTWFLANLMQFYWIAPIVLVPLAFGLRVVGLVLMGLLVVVQIVSTVVLEININGDVLRRQSDYLWRIYQQPYCRVAPYALGLAVGFILHQKKFKFPMGKIITCVGWLLTVTITTILTLITYDENRHLLNDATGWSHPVRTAHETLQRPLWALAVCWVIFACASGNGGLINKFFSWRGFVPLSRLTYCVYLIHPVVVIADLMAYRVFAYFTISYVLFRYIGYIVVGYLLALILAVLVQAPLLALEKTIFQKKSAH
ncbi:uncharacterized protein LOC112556054 [Pomacea canaliculata]|uniref:uncharacterized protein LOC112556054 n=1 Tax=Pomacea canaliculata TaxID=400727 RepID=UPI000D72B6E3|nr:uncharacterized protein LOC112556054 [Pomacea canaliculata]